MVKIFYSNNRNASRTEFKFILDLVASFKIAMSKSKPRKTRAVFQLGECLNAYTEPQGSVSSTVWWCRFVIPALRIPGLRIRKSRLIWAT